ncbi:MAG: PilW family protein [Gammaproteobacteria bacterium]|nr:PilW family protein [Gammaproteobacteria bacterium]MBU1443466.1 PilW family protein [Gammaproteobacteria bacterium]MBU2288913.1 PilW family protein [Gammaproteobacteria bacterium]MBU2407667.1 PilW family protein [Gammaproteobacteria bacterium]
MKTPIRRTSLARKQHGMTLVELMVSLVLGLLVMAAVAAIYLVASINLTQQDAESRLQQSGAAAMAIVTRQLEKAGVVDMPADWEGWKTATAGEDRFGYLMRNITPALSSAAIPPTVHGCDTGYANPTDLDDQSCSTSATTNSPAITLGWQVTRSRDSEAPPPPLLGCLDIDETHEQSANVNSLNTLVAGVPTPVVTRWTRCRISINTSDPSLQLRQSSDGTSVAVSVADNISDLQFRYLVSPAGDSSRVAQYATASAFTTGSTPPNWSDVTGVEVCLLTRVAVPTRASKQVQTCQVNTATGLPATTTFDDRFLYRAVRKVVVLRSRVQANTAAY